MSNIASTKICHWTDLDPVQFTSHSVIQFTTIHLNILTSTFCAYK